MSVVVCTLAIAATAASGELIPPSLFVAALILGLKSSCDSSCDWSRTGVDWSNEKTRLCRLVLRLLETEHRAAAA